MTTNEEWLKSLPTEELVKYIAQGGRCAFCAWGGHVMPFNCYRDCENGITAWLKQERK